MNMNTIIQELNKKLKKMNEEDFKKFIFEIIRIYEKHHYHGLPKTEWIYRG